MFASALVVKAQDTEALQSYSSNFGGYTAVTAGWSFTPLTNITVTALGCFDYSVSFQSEPISVGLWSADGSLLASNSVTTNSALVNQVWYEPITAVPLLANETYYLGAYSSADGMVISTYSSIGGSGGYVNMASEVQLGMAVFSTNQNFSFPDTAGGPSGSAILAPNFQFTDGITFPTLNMVCTNNAVVISWPASYAGLVLQENNDLTTTNWMTMTNPVAIVERQRQVLLPAPVGNDFYRLKSP